MNKLSMIKIVGEIAGYDTFLRHIFGRAIGVAVGRNHYDVLNEAHRFETISIRINEKRYKRY